MVIFSPYIIYSLLDEEILISKFLNVLTKKGFPYLSILEGGFDGMSSILNRLKIDFLSSKAWTPKSATTKADNTAHIKDTPLSYTNRHVSTPGKIPLIPFITLL